MFKILIPEDIAETGKRYLQERGYELKVGVPVDVESLKREIRNVDGLIVRNAKYPAEVIVEGTKLKVIGRHGTGVDNIDVEEAEKRGIYVVNGPTANINAVAEYTIAMMLGLSCGLLQADQKTRQKDWSYRLSMRRHELEGTVLGLIGYGRISRLVAQKAVYGFGMKVIAYDIQVPEGQGELISFTDNLDEVIARADYLSLHIPSTPETRGMFDYSKFCRMKPGACFINCARGDLYVEHDLVRVLQEGHLRGAALDVYREEPLKDSPLLTMEQVILSQHNAGLSEESKDKMSLYAAMGVDDVLMGREPAWSVNHPPK